VANCGQLPEACNLSVAITAAIHIQRPQLLPTPGIWEFYPSPCHCLQVLTDPAPVDSLEPDPAAEPAQQPAAEEPAAGEEPAAAEPVPEPESQPIGEPEVPAKEPEPELEPEMAPAVSPLVGSGFAEEIATRTLW